MRSGSVEFLSICTCSGAARALAQVSTRVMVVRVCGWAFDLRLVASGAGTLDGFKEVRVSRAPRLLFMTDDAGVRLVAPTVTWW